MIIVMRIISVLGPGHCLSGREQLAVDVVCVEWGRRTPFPLHVHPHTAAHGAHVFVCMCLCVCVLPCDLCFEK